MRQCVLILAMLMAAALTAGAKRVSVDAVNQPAAAVFRDIMRQTGMNFVYSSDLLEGLNVTIKASDKPLKKVLSEIFADTDIEYKIKGNNVMLKRKHKKETAAKQKTKPVGTRPAKDAMQPTDITLLKEVIVESCLESPAVETSDIGSAKVTAADVRSTPALLGEADVVKTLHARPGVTGGIEGLAGMYVHGGNADENLYLLENVPLYHVNHFAGLFSSFNPDIIRYVDFFKSSMPAKYDGRLSSFTDVRLLSGSEEGHHGSARLGNTSGTFNISGPIGSKTAYILGVRRSWFDLLSSPLVAIANAHSDDEQLRFHYHFMDLNAKVNHRFSPNTSAFVNVYYGDDILKTGTKDKGIDRPEEIGGFDDDRYDMHWGNLLVQTGMNHGFSPELSAEFTAAYTQFFSSMKYDYRYVQRLPGNTGESHSILDTDNNIHDRIARSDFTWLANDASKVRFGAGYVRHSFLPQRDTRYYETGSAQIESRDSSWTYGADEFSVYAEDDWKISDIVRLNAGLHASLFHIGGKTNYGISPRLSASFRPVPNWAVKAAYSRTTQYVHQLSQSYLSLPTDQWIPIMGRLKPQTADKISIGGYWQSADGTFVVSAEGYWKWMHNLVDYRDEYYLRPPLDIWSAQLCSGRGTAKGVDAMVEKTLGKVTGHIAYSLAWADRTFADKNGGRTFPAKFDNRHTIKAMLSWKISVKTQLNAVWIGHSGNRFTLLNQVWEGPWFDDSDWMGGDAPLRAPINGYRLPFYHRLDLSLEVKNLHGYWTFGLYNAYSHQNTVAVKRGTQEVWETDDYGNYLAERPAFKRVKLLPIIPSISYTWLF